MSTDRSMFTNKTPHFFKVILQETLSDGKLGIPQNFIRKYALQLPSQVHLEVPNGAKWEVELAKSDERVWLQKGWPEFAENFGIKHGHFLVFRYEGNADFHVLIFDITAAEVDYPIEQEDDDVIILDDISMFPSQLRKKRKVDSLSETRTSMKSRVAYARVNHPKRQKIEKSKRTERLTEAEKAKARKKVSRGFKTGNPSFMVVMQPSFVSSRYRMGMPSSFTKKYLEKFHGNNIILISLSTRETWTTSYYHGDGQNPQLRHGWREFAEHNALEVGDVCAF